MKALTFDRSRESWSKSTGMVLEDVPCPTLTDPNGADRSEVIIRVHFTGFCGSDRGIWWRKAFGSMVADSLDADGGDRRIFGHEMLGEIVEIGSRVEPKYGYRVGDIVTTESHIVCGTCPQCRQGQQHVCSNDKIIGISRDGCFAEFVKLPAKALWRTDVERVRPEVAAIQEPFGNAVHACQVTDLRGKRVVILGTGTIGLFALLIAKSMGAATVIGVDPSPSRRDQARRLGCDVVLAPRRAPEDKPWAHDPELRGQILEVTRGIGADVTLEMAGFNDSLNNAIQITRRGGTVVLFGVRDGAAVIEDAQQIVMNGLQLHGVVGRRLWQTWKVTQALLEQTDNGVQEAIWDIILNRGQETIVKMADWDRDRFEGVIDTWPKAVLDWR